MKSCNDCKDGKRQDGSVGALTGGALSLRGTPCLFDRSAAKQRGAGKLLCSARIDRPPSVGCCRHRRGVTLIEIVFAFLILVIAALGASGIISYGHRGTQKDFREVEAIQLLGDRMNQVLAIPFEDLDPLLTFGDQATFSATLFGATPQEVVLGPIVQGPRTYTAEVSLQRQPVILGFCPINIPNSPNYLPGVATSWNFDALNTDLGRFDGSDAVVHPFKTLKVIVRVSWNEPVVTAPTREYFVVSFVTDLR